MDKLLRCKNPLHCGLLSRISAADMPFRFSSYDKELSNPLKIIEANNKQSP